MPTSGFLECNQNFKYPKKLPAALNSSILAENGAGSTNNSYFMMPSGHCPPDAFYTEISTLKVQKIACGAKRSLGRKEKREKKKNKIREKLFIKSTKASRPSTCASSAWSAESAFSPSYKAEILTLETRSTEKQTVKCSAS